MRIVVDDQPIEYADGDSVAVAIVRAGQHPQHGGTLCLAGDCGNCCAEIDGVAFTRTCLTPAQPGLRVVRHPAGRWSPAAPRPAGRSGRIAEPLRPQRCDDSTPTSW